MIESHLWWQRGVVYHVYPRSFADSNGHGVGDLPGITGRLDYLAGLGVDAVWLSPIYTSPMADFGYDITDHTDADPLFGTLSDFDELVTEAHLLGLKVLLGNVAADDPEGVEVHDSLLSRRDEEGRIIILQAEDTALVNALQRKAAVVLQKSVREGFGLTVAEAMWKGTPVVGGDVGGIRRQIKDGENGLLVSSVEEAAERIVRLLEDEDLRRRMGRKATETVRERYLMTRYLEQYLDLFGSFEASYRLRDPETSSAKPGRGSFSIDNNPPPPL